MRIARKFGCILSAFIALLLLPGGMSDARAESTMTLEAMGEMVALSGATLSPDGKRVALVTTHQDFARNRFVNALWLVSTKSGAQMLLAGDRSGLGSPRWSPDGDRLAWLDSAGEGGAQIYVLDVRKSGGVAAAITHAPQGVSAFRWSPDGSSFAFLSADPALERTGDEKYNRSFEAGDNDYLTTAAPTSSHIWVVSAKGGEARKLTSGVESVLNLEWEGARSLAFVSQPRPHHAEFLNASLNLVDVSSGIRRVLIPPPSANDNGAVARIWASPADSGMVLYGQPRGIERDYRPLGVYVMPVSGGARRNLAPSLDLDLYREPVWLPDGKSVVVSATEGTGAVLWRQPLQGKPQRLQTGSLSQIESLSGSQNAELAFIGSDSHTAPELYYMPSTHGVPRRLTNFNARITDLRLGKVETVRWTLDGFSQNGVLTYPPDYDAKKKYPLVLVVHGGPMGVSTEALGDFEGPFAHMLAARGWLVFRPNYRGSNGDGAAFQAAIIGDAGDGPGRDVMAGVETLKSRGIVDPDRMAVSGWSYGGFMTAWLTAHYPVWRAAVAGAALTDWFDAYNLGDENVWNGQARGGSPWRKGKAEEYWKQSPMAYAHQIRAPTLILANSGDQRVPITQSYKLYHALKDNGVPVQFIVYPLMGHWPDDPVHQRDLYRRWASWIDEHFRAAEVEQ